MLRPQQLRQPFRPEVPARRKPAMPKQDPAPRCPTRHRAARSRSTSAATAASAIAIDRNTSDMSNWSSRKFSRSYSASSRSALARVSFERPSYFLMSASYSAACLAASALSTWPVDLEQPQLVQAVLVDMQLHARELILGPGVDRVGLRLLHRLIDVVVLDLRDRHEHREDHHRDGDQIVQALVFRACRSCVGCSMRALRIVALRPPAVVFIRGDRLRGPRGRISPHPRAAPRRRARRDRAPPRLFRPSQARHRRRAPEACRSCVIQPKPTGKSARR